MTITDRSTATGEYSVELSDTAPPMPWPDKTPYEQWCEQQGVPIVRGFHVPDLTDVETGPWAGRDVAGAIIALDGADDTNGSYLIKIDRSGASVWQRHVYEELFYAVSGTSIAPVPDTA